MAYGPKPILKMLLVVPIHNIDKDPQLVLSYRPISLPSVFTKICERLIELRLDWWMEENHTLPNQQFGFRKSVGCIDTLTYLILGRHGPYNTRLGGGRLEKG
ncbi:hypothetical protein Trydic_g1878 [Trypoxylus dichotomus]